MSTMPLVSIELAQWVARLNNLAPTSAGRVLACRADGSAAAIYAADRAPSSGDWILWTITGTSVEVEGVLALLAPTSGTSVAGPTDSLRTPLDVQESRRAWDD